MSIQSVAGTFMQDSVRMAAEHGPVFQRSLFNLDFTFVTSPALVAELADESRFTKHVLPPLAQLRGLTQDGLFTAYSDEPAWQVAHDVLVPAFSRAAMRGHHSIMRSVTGELVAYLRARCGSGPVAILPAAERLTLEVISRSGFGHTFDSLKTERPHHFVTMLEDVLTHAQREAARPRLAGGLLGTRAAERNAENIGHLHDVVETVIAQHDPHEGDAGLLHLMLKSAALDPAGIRNQVLTFLAAGHETTSGALAFALYFLAANPTVQDRARAEAGEVLASEPASFEQIGKLRYLRKVVDESLRLWPTGPGYSRQALVETTLGRRSVSAGEPFFVLLPALHRDPVWGPDPDRFDPCRFDAERVRARPPHCYKPFGTGARACIGRQFALHQIVLVLAELVRRFDFVFPAGHTLRVAEGFTLRPAGLELELTPRGDSHPADMTSRKDQ